LTLRSRIFEFVQFQRARYRRLRKMESAEIGEKLQARLSLMLSYRTLVRRLAYHLNAYSIGLHPDGYMERTEVGPQNIDVKHARVQQGGPFEPHSVSVVNRAAATLLRDERSILEVGCGTGMFSYLAAEEPHRMVTASELDEDTLRWTVENRNRQNIDYCSRALTDFDSDEFDIVVAIELIEHVDDFPGFLKSLSRVAPAAIVSTPNKNRSPLDSIANTPVYDEHVREWTAGEFYWVLRAFYGDVKMYTIPNFRKEIERYRFDSNSVPSVSRCSVLEQAEPLLAMCTKPIRH